jgi:hypothetical protein
MIDEKPPADEEKRYKYTDETQTKVDRRYSPLRVLSWIIAILLVIFGVVWLGYAIGLLAAVFPVGVDIFGGWIWGMLGLAGIALIVILIRGATR